MLSQLNQSTQLPLTWLLLALPAELEARNAQLTEARKVRGLSCFYFFCWCVAATGGAAAVIELGRAPVLPIPPAPPCCGVCVQGLPPPHASDVGHNPPYVPVNKRNSLGGPGSAGSRGGGSQVWETTLCGSVHRRLVI